MGSEKLLTRLDLETIWGMTRFGVSARIRKYGQDVRKVQKGNTVTFAVTREEADRIELAAVESALEARRKSGATRTREVSKRKPAPVKNADGETLVTSAQLAKRWGVTLTSARKRVRKYGIGVEMVQSYGRTVLAVRESEVDKIEADCYAARGRTTGDFAKIHGLSISREIEALRSSLTSNRRKSGWKASNATLLPERPPEPTAPRLPPCEPTVAGVIARYHVSKQVVRGWILDGLMRVDADGTVDAESMARVKRCYQERRPTRWMEKTLAEFGSL